jgi:hypothetical protein
MLEHDAAVRDLVGHPVLMDASLQLPGDEVVDGGGAQVQVNKLAVHLAQLTSA